MVVLVGLVASATHLGNPENALYVLSRVGQSPLSTEVATAVVFLGIAGVQWMYQYAERYRRGFSRGLLVAASLAALGMVVAIAFAYASITVLSWNTAYVPLLTGLNAAMSGP
ncbi:dimethyl sulfoxide reductase anchor subunit, partial [Adlercreutzia equolifaciens]|uniref:DmsC/YnfH family molybdoenzyme membrane anchor subunit n=1 Tax=Adlercreutzia equolifaciens TaxID=446660 RepID=UPI0023AF0FB8